MKIVLDTNLLIDGSSDDYNYGSRIVDEILAGKLEAYANPATIAENRHMARKRIHEPEYLEKLDRLFDVINVFETKNRLGIVEDPDDNKILESAVESESEYLITSDKHLLKIEEYDGVKIVPPSSFWQIYQEETGSGWQNWLKDFIN